MRKLQYFKGLLALFAVSTLVSCATNRSRAIDLSAEVYNRHWGNWQKVIEVATKAIEIDPDFAWPYYQRGVAYSALGETNKAIEDMTAALKIDPDLGDAYTDRAAVFIQRRDFTRAELDLNAALSLDPTDTKTLVAMAELYSMQGNAGGACMFLRRAVNNGFRDLYYLKSNENFKRLLESDCIFELFPGNR